MHNRRNVLAGGAAMVGAAALSSCNIGGAGKPVLKWLGWEHYDDRELREQFEAENDCLVRAQYFDGNSEAWAKLQNGGDKDFHLVMADGFWPQLYSEKGHTVEVDDSRIKNMDGVFTDFLNPKYRLLHSKINQNRRIAVPNCWGGYGLTVNQDKVDPAHSDSLTILFGNAPEGKKISTSARFEENIALAGILACHELGTINQDRPGGGLFDPYNLTDRELNECKKLLLDQHKKLVTRWSDEDTLERLLRDEKVYVSPEWSGIYRRIHFEKLDGTSQLNMKHVLKPREGGLGWVDTWCLTKGATVSPEIEDLAYKWMNFRLEKKSMLKIATDVGWAPCIDIREDLRSTKNGDPYIDTLFLDRTSDINGLYQFNNPSNPEKWEAIWSEVLAS